MLDYQEELNEAVKYYVSITPIEIKKAVRLLNQDLYLGSSAVDDEDYKGFITESKKVREWLDDHVEDRKLSYFIIDDNDNEVEEDAGFIDSKDICKALLGNELYNTIY
jgi:hypothetical protein